MINEKLKKQQKFHETIFYSFCFLAAKEIGFLGYNWVTRYHKSDCDIPTKDMWGKELKDSIEENRISEIWRRLQKKPKYESLLVEPREERYPRAIGLQNLETS